MPRKRHVLNIVRDDKIVADAHHLTLSELARKHGLSYSRIQHILKKAKVKAARPNGRPPKAPLEKLKALEAKYLRRNSI